MSRLSDEIHVGDAGIARLYDTSAGAEFARREWETVAENSVIQVKGWVSDLVDKNRTQAVKDWAAKAMKYEGGKQ